MMAVSDVSVAEDIKIRASGVELEGMLTIPESPVGIVIFAHGSGSSRFSRRNIAVADYFNRQGLATLLFDLLTEEESILDERTREHRFNIPLLGLRLVAAVDWAGAQSELQNIDIGLFGASTGAAGALIAAAERPAYVSAVVSRGGRPDLAGDALPRVRAPTLLIVGGLDDVVIDLNRKAAQALQCEYRLEIVPGATHLFEEPGKLEQVSLLACNWFTAHLDRSRAD